MSMKSFIFWDTTPCSPSKVNRRFGWTCGLHLQGRRINQARNQREVGKDSHYSLALKMEAKCSSEMSVDFQRTTRHYIDRTIHNHRCENFESYLKHVHDEPQRRSLKHGECDRTDWRKNCIRKELGSNLGRVTGYSDWGLSWISSLSMSRWYPGPTTNVSFQILPNMSVFLAHNTVWKLKAQLTNPQRVSWTCGLFWSHWLTAASLHVLCAYLNKANNSTEEIKSRRTRWTGYVRKKRNAYMVLVAKPERDH
jgi:hypothetical protein